jgi:hypothetical protein
MIINKITLIYNHLLKKLMKISNIKSNIIAKTLKIFLNKFLKS